MFYKWVNPYGFGYVDKTASVGQQKQALRPYETKLYERPDAKPIKVSLYCLVMSFTFQCIMYHTFQCE